MAFVETPAAPYTDNNTNISATVANTWKRDIARGLDVVGGSDGVPATPATPILIHAPVTVETLSYTSEVIERVSTSPVVNTTDGTLGVGNAEIGPNDIGICAFDRMPHGASWTSATIYHDRNDSGSLPTTRVRVSLYKLNITTGASTTIVAPTTDPNFTLAPYQAHHGITLTISPAETIDCTKYLYFARLDGESGSNAETTLMFAPIATFTITAQDKAP